jgi:hypothetical protein
MTGASYRSLPPSGRFVVLEHDHPHLHWDFMLEANGVLVTWRLPWPPRTGTCEAVKLGDHRLAYLDYEGPVSGDRGIVKRWDAGIYRLENANIDLRGKRWAGRVEFKESDGRWMFHFVEVGH